jgi:predicted aldo/keto reductase-like oxidoreductase
MKMSSITIAPRNARNNQIDDDNISNVSSLYREMSASVETLNNESLSVADIKRDKLPSIENLFTLVKKDLKDQSVGCFRCYKCPQGIEVLAVKLFLLNLLILIHFYLKVVKSKSF